MQSTFDYLQVLLAMNDDNKEKAPVLDHYDFEQFTSNSPNPLLRIQQSLVKALNIRGYLPTLILYLLDDDLFTTPKLYLPSEIELHLCWIFSTCDDMLKT